MWKADLCERRVCGRLACVRGECVAGWLIVFCTCMPVCLVWSIKPKDCWVRTDPIHSLWVTAETQLVEKDVLLSAYWGGGGGGGGVNTKRAASDRG